MSNIGTFQRVDAGFAGSIRTMTVTTKARFVAMERTGDKSPDFRIYGGSGANIAEIGAAWRRTGRQTGLEYLSCRIDDPAFAQPVHAVLVENSGDANFSLIWSRKE